MLLNRYIYFQKSPKWFVKKVLSHLRFDNFSKVVKSVLS